MRGPHSAPWGRKSGAGQGAAQIAMEISVAAGKMRAGQLQNGLHAHGGRPLSQQVPGDPQIHDAPIRLRKALANAPALDTALVDDGGFGWGDGCRGEAVPLSCLERQPSWCGQRRHGLQQGIALGATPAWACTIFTQGA